MKFYSIWSYTRLMVKEVKEDNPTQAESDGALQSFQCAHGRDWSGDLCNQIPGSSVILRLRLSSTMGRRNFSDHRHATTRIAKHEMDVFIIFKLECQQDRIHGDRGSLRLAALVEIGRTLHGAELSYRDRPTILEPWIIAQYLDGPSFFAASPSAGCENQHQHEIGECFELHAGECSRAGTPRTHRVEPADSSSPLFCFV